MHFKMAELPLKGEVSIKHFNQRFSEGLVKTDRLFRSVIKLWCILQATTSEQSGRTFSARPSRETGSGSSTCRLCRWLRPSSSRLSLDARVDGERENARFMLTAPWLNLHWTQYASYSSSTCTRSNSPKLKLFKSALKPDRETFHLPCWCETLSAVCTSPTLGSPAGAAFMIMCINQICHLRSASKKNVLPFPGRRGNPASRRAHP